jgi:hypothetical protein
VALINWAETRQSEIEHARAAFEVAGSSALAEV